MPPGLVRVSVAAAGATAVAAGLVAAANGVLPGIALAVGGLVFVAWSIFGP